MGCNLVGLSGRQEANFIKRVVEEKGRSILLINEPSTIETLELGLAVPIVIAGRSGGG